MLKYLNSFIRVVILFLICACASAPASQEIRNSTGHKINGISLVASKDSLKNENMVHVARLNANYAAVMPFAFTRSLDNPNVQYNSERQWFGETKNGVLQYVSELTRKKIKIMIKPQIWVWHGEFTGDISMKSEEEWQVLEHSYRSFILFFANVAQECNAEIFCIGTELRKFQEARPTYWLALIDQVRAIYQGKLTYAANWDEYKSVPFWKKLDYIGVDAYFPISDEKTPSIEQARAGWQVHKTKMREISELNKKPILFTEFGYCSRDYALSEPWNPQDKTLNLVAQSNGMHAVFEEFWDEEWFAGGFIWKWFPDYQNVGGLQNIHFTPQNKPAEKIIQQVYADH